MMTIVGGGKSRKWLVILGVTALALAASACGGAQKSWAKGLLLVRPGVDAPLTSWPAPNGSVVSLVQCSAEGTSDTSGEGSTSQGTDGNSLSYVLERRTGQGDLVTSIPVRTPQIGARVQCVGSLADGRGLLVCTEKMPSFSGECPTEWFAWFSPDSNSVDIWVPCQGCPDCQSCPEAPKTDGIVWGEVSRLVQDRVLHDMVVLPQPQAHSYAVIGNYGNVTEQWNHVIGADRNGFAIVYEVRQWGDDALLAWGEFAGELRLDGMPLLTGPDRTSLLAPTTDEKLFVLRFSREDGKLLWARETGPLGFASDGNCGACLTPRGTVVLVSHHKGEAAFNLKDGSRSVLSAGRLGGRGGLLGVEIDQEGEFLWAQTLAAKSSPWLDCTASLSDGSLIVRGDIYGEFNRDGEIEEVGSDRLLVVFETPVGKSEKEDR